MWILIIITKQWTMNPYCYIKMQKSIHHLLSKKFLIAVKQVPKFSLICTHCAPSAYKTTFKEDVDTWTLHSIDMKLSFYIIDVYFFFKYFSGTFFLNWWNSSSTCNNTLSTWFKAGSDCSYSISRQLIFRNTFHPYTLQVTKMCRII